MSVVLPFKRKPKKYQPRPKKKYKVHIFPLYTDFDQETINLLNYLERKLQEKLNAQELESLVEQLIMEKH